MPAQLDVLTGDFEDHVLIGGRGHVDTVTGGVFEDQGEEHGCTSLKYVGGCGIICL